VRCLPNPREHRIGAFKICGKLVLDVDAQSSLPRAKRGSTRWLLGLPGLDSLGTSVCELTIITVLYYAAGIASHIADATRESIPFRHLV
jgi:hypothetical protein